MQSEVMLTPEMLNGICSEAVDLTAFNKSSCCWRVSARQPNAESVLIYADSEEPSV